MPPRFAYWTILAGGLPTAFRAADRDDLLPTFQRIKQKHPDAEMKYFARGKLWESQEAARAAQTRGGARNRERERPGGARLDEAGRERERRSRDWRPGGDHRDPRQKFIDAKKERNAAIRQDRWRRKHAEGIGDQVSGFKGGQGKRPEGNRPQGTRPQGTRPQGTRPQGARPQGARPQGARPQGARPQGNKPQGARPQGAKPQGSWPQGGRPQASRRPSDRKPWPRGQGTEEPPQPPRPRGPNREPRPAEEPKPAPPPQADEPTTPAPGPPERGQSRRPFRPRGRFPKGPRR